jgi:hypothetical protein
MTLDRKALETSFEALVASPAESAGPASTSEYERTSEDAFAVVAGTMIEGAEAPRSRQLPSGHLWRGRKGQLCRTWRSATAAAIPRSSRSRDEDPPSPTSAFRTWTRR